MDTTGKVEGDHAGKFVRTAWYERGLEHGNPYFDKRFRVNAPETSLTPEWMYRTEARENGMMLISINEDLALLRTADLYAEVWGGHPGTTNKRFTINGRSTYALPEVGTAAGHCTYSYPRIPLKLTDLVNGYNAIQFACDIGTGFWGHFIVDNAALHLVLQPEHPDLAAANLSAFHASVAWQAVTGDRECYVLSLNYPSSFLDHISHVDYFAHYAGYDENGNGSGIDWHGFTKIRQPAAIVGCAAQPSYSTTWHTNMLPTQNNVSIRANVHFKGYSNLTYQTASSNGPNIYHGLQYKVTLHPASHQPAPFWSRAGNEKKCTIMVESPPDKIENAELHVVIWDGGAGSMENPFTINGYPLTIAGSGAHDVLYRVMPISPQQLKKGENEIILCSDTEHHGIEILLPGPCLVIRTKV